MNIKKLSWEFFIISLFLIVMTNVVKADVVGNLIANGDFQTFDTASMTSNGNSTTSGYSWRTETTHQGNCQTQRLPQWEAGNNHVCIIGNYSSTVTPFAYCNGYSSNCLNISFQTGGSVNGLSILSNLFTWDSNSSWGILRLYQKGNSNGNVYLYQGTSTCVTYGNPGLSCQSSTYISQASLAVTSTITYREINMTGFAQNGQNYYLAFEVPDTYSMDNVTLTTGNNTLAALWRRSYGYCVFPPNDLTKIQSCVTPPIDISDCLSAANYITSSYNFYNMGKITAPYNTVDCSRANGTVTIERDFNASGTIVRNTTNVCDIVGNISTVSDTAFDNSFATIKSRTNTSIAQCSFENSNNNVTLFSIACEQNLLCSVNFTDVANNCNTICLGSNLYTGNFYDSATNTCNINNANKTYCVGGCWNRTQCAIPNLFNSSGLLATRVNATDTFTYNSMSFLTSFSGIIWLCLILTSTLITIKFNEHFAVLIFTIINFLFSLVGVFPIGYGINVAILGFVFIILGNAFGFKKK